MHTPIHRHWDRAPLLFGTASFAVLSLLPQKMVFPRCRDSAFAPWSHLCWLAMDSADTEKKGAGPLLTNTGVCVSSRLFARIGELPLPCAYGCCIRQATRQGSPALVSASMMHCATVQINRRSFPCKYKEIHAMRYGVCYDRQTRTRRDGHGQTQTVQAACQVATGTQSGVETPSPRTGTASRDRGAGGSNQAAETRAGRGRDCAVYVPAIKGRARGRREGGCVVRRGAGCAGDASEDQACSKTAAVSLNYPRVTIDADRASSLFYITPFFWPQAMAVSWPQAPRIWT